MGLTRREFIAGVVAAPALVRLARKAPRPIAGGFVDDGMSAGHSLRDGGAATQRATERRRVSVAIVGGGIAGLSAAWELDRRGFRDFVVLELLTRAGGNARAGANEVSAYPWAAHYVPVPGARATLVRELFEELGVLRDGVWEERSLCFSPQERLFLYGEWHAGLEPEFAMTAADRADFRRFADVIAAQRASGQFTIPSALGVRRESPLDTLSMDAWLTAQGFTSPRLRWYVDYACRDDYALTLAQTSAWAGLFYFAARQSAPDAEPQPVVTWPDGNRALIGALARGVTIEVRQTLGPIRDIAGDAAELREALINLILNAVDAMPGGGTLTLSTRDLDGHVEVRVGDTGLGIPPEVREKIFDPFFTTKGPQGTGLGLSMTYGIVSRHGGLITVDSEEGRGSTFCLTFPAATTPAAAPAMTTSSAAPRRMGRIRRSTREMESAAWRGEPRRTQPTIGRAD